MILTKIDRNKYNKRSTQLNVQKSNSNNQWTKYTVTSCAIKMLREGTTPLVRRMRDIMYINDRKLLIGKFVRTAKSKIGKDLSNKLDTLGE